MKKHIAALAVVLGAALSACAVPTEADSTTHADEVVAAQESATKPKAEKSKPKPPPAPKYTVPQENAIATAADYLDYSAFSHSGLVDQLKYEGYSPALAEFGVSHIKVNWNVQAAASAKDYLDYSAFSRSGLIDQLTYEGFTTKQAVYGVNQTGL